MVCVASNKRTISHADNVGRYDASLIVSKGLAGGLPS